MSVEYVTRPVLQEELKKFGDQLEERVEKKFDAKLDQRFDAFEHKIDVKLDQRFDAFEKRIDAKFEQRLDQRFEAFEKKFDDKFATKDDLDRFATKEDLERFATKKDLEAFATKKDLERFATKEELSAALATMASKEDVQALHHHFDVAVEQFRSEIRLLADGFQSVDKRTSKLRKYTRTRLDQQDVRIDRLDAKVYLLNQRVGMNVGDEAGETNLPPSTS